MNPLDDLPAPSSKRLAIRVTNDALRQIRSGHPWVFDRSILSVDKVEGSTHGAVGDLGVIFDSDRNFAAIGLFDPASPIRIRVLEHGRPVAIDDAFWSNRIRAAIARRTVLAATDTTGYRVVHGENDGLPGLVVDRYDTTLVMKIYTASWLPHLKGLVEALHEQLQPTSVVLRLSRDVGGRVAGGVHDGMPLLGDAPLEPVLFHENALIFEADVIHGQKTGHFLDQRDNRNRVRALARGKRVLDVFASTGGFSVYAAAGGAVSVHSVDMSAPALAAAQRNMLHNSFITAVRNCEHTTQADDAFEAMRGLAARHRRYDIVIVDPPSFARKNSDRARAMSAYQRLTRLALDLVEPDGVLVQSSCSTRVNADDFYDGIHAAANSSDHRITDMVRTAHAVDHPIGFAEGAYLKTLFARVKG